MSDPGFPDWLIEQKGRRYRDGAKGKYLGRDTLVRRYARHLQSLGEPVTHAAIRSMLAYVDRGYSMKADQISRALSALYHSEDRPLPKAQNGWPVTIEGRQYASARAAAEGQGISVQTVLRRVASAESRWSEWLREGG